MSDRDRRDRRDSEEEPPPVVIRDKRKFDADFNLKGGDPAASWPGAGPDDQPVSQQDVDAQVALLDLQTQVEERTADLQRLTAEYANYRKRVDRDRVTVGEVATGRVVEAFLPVLDDIERAAAHGDLTGAFKAVADKIAEALSRLGLQTFGQNGDVFDPALHEAVLHDESDEVTTATATNVMRRGYRLGERLLRPAMVGVTAPASGGSARSPETAFAEPASGQSASSESASSESASSDPASPESTFGGPASPADQT